MKLHIKLAPSALLISVDSYQFNAFDLLMGQGRLVVLGDEIQAGMRALGGVLL